MSIQHKTIGVFAALALVALPSIALAEGVSRAAYNRALDRIDELEAQQVAYYEEGGYEGDFVSSYGGCDSCSGGGCDSCYGGGGGYLSDSCYGGCGDTCCLGCGFYMLYENVVAQPYFSRDSAYFGEYELDSVTNGWAEHSFDWDTNYSPRVEIGFQPACGLGIRARYWYYDNDASLRGAEASNTVEAWHAIDLDATDLELTANKGGLLYSGGLRYVRLDQNYEAQSFNAAVLQDDVRVHHNFEGVGPTLAVEGSTCGRWCGFGLFAKARGSLLYGDSSSTFMSNLVDTVSNGVVGHSRDDLIAIAELQIGVDWQRCCHWGTLYLSAALEAQYWHNAGSGAPGFTDNVRGYYNESAFASDLGFLGGTFGVGLLW